MKCVNICKYIFIYMVTMYVTCTATITMYIVVLENTGAILIPYLNMFVYIQVKLRISCKSSFISVLQLKS